MKIEIPVPVLRVPRLIEQWLTSMNVPLDKPITLIFQSERRDDLHSSVGYRLSDVN